MILLFHWLISKITTICTRMHPSFITVTTFITTMKCALKFDNLECSSATSIFISNYFECLKLYFTINLYFLTHKCFKFQVRLILETQTIITLHKSSFKFPNFSLTLLVFDLLSTNIGIRFFLINVEIIFMTD